MKAKRKTIRPDETMRDGAWPIIRGYCEAKDEGALFWSLNLYITDLIRRRPLAFAPTIISDEVTSYDRPFWNPIPHVRNEPTGLRHF